MPQPLSGDVQGMAPSRPDNPNPGVIPPMDLPKDAVPAASNPAKPEDRAPASAPPAQYSPDNPFAQQAQQPDQTAQATPQDQPPPAGQYSPDNPFAAMAQPQPEVPIATPPAASPVKDYIRTNLAAHAAMNPPPGPGQPTPIEAQNPIMDFAHGLGAGLGMSVTGLFVNGKMPDTILPEHADLAMRIGSQIGTMAGDLPAMIAGGLIGGAAGTVEAPLVGTVGFGMAGAFAAPPAIRRFLMDRYQGGHHDTRDFVASLMASAYEGLKGGAVGMATGVAGGLAGKAVLGAEAGAAVEKGLASPLSPAYSPAKMAAELTTMTTVGAALEGHLPQMQDFIDGAIVLGGFHGFTKAYDATRGRLPPSAEGQPSLIKKLQEVWANTGERPQDVIARAERDVTLRQNLIADNEQSPPEAAPTRLEHSPVMSRDGIVEGSNSEFRVSRLDTADYNPEATKPHGTYMSIVDNPDAFKSPHEDAGQTEYKGVARPQNPLVLEGEDVQTRTRTTPGGGPVSGSAGVLALKKLLPPEEFARVADLKTSELRTELEEKYPKDDFSKYHDGYELMEAYGAKLAKAAGHDALVLRDKADPNFSEAAILDNRIVEWGKPKEPGAPAEKKMPPKPVGVDSKLVPLSAEERGVAPPSPPEPPEPPKPGSPEDDIAGVLDHQGEHAKEKAPTWNESFKDWYARSIDRYAPLAWAEESAKAAGATIRKSAYDLARVFAGHMDTVDSVFKFGTRDQYGNINGEGINQILEGLKPDQLNKLRAYGMAAHALELDDRGIKPWGDFDRAQAERVVAHLKDEYEPLHQRLVDFSNRLLDWAAAKGRYSPEQVAAMKEANKQYSPSSRAFEADTFEGEQTQGSRGIKKIYGDDRDILDPLQQRYRNAEKLIKDVKINETRFQFLSNMREANLVGSGGKLEDQTGNFLNLVPKELNPITVKGSEILRALEKQGEVITYKKFADRIRSMFPGASEEHIADLYEKEIREGRAPQINPDDATFWRARQPPLADNQIAIWENGERHVYEGTEGVISSLKALDGDPIAMDMTTKVLRAFTNAVRVGVVSNPAFGFAHFFRSQVNSFLNSRTGMRPFEGFLYLKDFMQESPAYQQWLYDGGASGGLFKLNDRYFEGRGLKEASPEWHDKAWNVIRKPFEASEAWIKLTDNLSRFAEYQRSLEQGSTRLEAAMNSREVVPDYAKAGLQRSILRTGVAFIGAHINSLDNMVNHINEDPKGYAMRASVIMGMSAALWAINHDDEAYQAIPDWQKNTYWNININRFSPHYSPEDATFVRLPKPWAPGIMLGSGTETVLDQFFTKDRSEREVQHFAHSIGTAVLPEVIPNILQPVMDQLENRQSFTGRPLVPEYKAKLLPELQYTPYTSETAKALAKLIGHVPLVKDLGPSEDPLASPAVVENYVRGWSGTLGGWALRFSDNVMRASGGKDIGDAASKFWHSDKAEPWQQTSFLSSFVSRYPSFSDQRVQDFYENKALADKAYESVRQMGAKDMDAAQKIMDAHPEFQVRLTDIAKGISTARKAYGNIQEDESIPFTEKRQLLDGLLFQIGSMAKEGNQIMRDFHQGLGETRMAGGSK